MSHPVARTDSPAPDLADAARRHRTVMRLGVGLVVLGLARWFLPESMPALVMGAMIGGAAVCVMLAWSQMRLWQAMGARNLMPAIMGILMLVPFANLVAIAFAHIHAGRVMHEAGLQLPILGASDKQIASLNASACASCGYNLRGVRNADCPDCGKPIARQHKAAA